MKHLILTIPAAAVLGFLYLAGASDTHAKNVTSCITAGCTKSAHAVPFPGEKGSPIVLHQAQASRPKAERAKPVYVKMAQGRIEIKTNMTDAEIKQQLSELFNQ